jgi:hypothetical protein
MAAKTTIYKLKSPRFTGTIFVNYRDGVFSQLDCTDADLSQEQRSYLLKVLPVQEQLVTDVGTMGSLTAARVVPRSVKEKLVLFCAYYKSYRSVSYLAKLLEKANLKDVPVNEELLKVFFESPLQNFTLKNYIDRINITKDQARNGRSGTAFPNTYEPTYYASLTGEALTAYRAHLRALGWQYDTTRQVWKEPGR